MKCPVELKAAVIEIVQKLELKVKVKESNYNKLAQKFGIIPDDGIKSLNDLSNVEVKQNEWS